MKTRFKSYTVLFFALVILLKAMTMPLLCLDFKERRRAYAAACINKMRPWMHCDGQCQLMKRLNKANDNNAQNETNEYKAHFIDYCEQMPDYTLSNAMFLPGKKDFNQLPNNGLLPLGNKMRLLQPPRLS